MVTRVCVVGSVNADLTFTVDALPRPGQTVLASALVTCIDGHPMAKRGEAAKALAVAAVSSFVAGTLTVVLLSVA
ncbi:tripartite tricarboxylate transporter permease, partial [Mycobacterium sp. NAZ190054]|uniref:tripartite tricarboxylate transporter permease n=1 Tax=Mycobacterium sp. NAZ190054 TaxID=1747766 RepID=UPI0018D264F4